MTQAGQRIRHPFDPVFDADSRVLILGSFPSVKSREERFYYGHPRNRFWKVISELFGEPLPATVPEKTRLLLRHGLALWDSVAECTVSGSSDASILNVSPNDLRVILEHSRVQTIVCNGRKSFEVYGKYIRPEIRREAICLPSTSPANAQWSTERLAEAWRVIRA